MPIPDQLPPELIPPSARDLDESVEAVKSLLQYENRSRSPSSIDSPVSRLKNRSFNTTGSSIESGRDATIYKHSDSEPPGGFYKPRSRHVDRDAVRRTDDISPSSDLSDMKRQLANTAQMLDRASEATAEDEELDREMDDLKYRVKRVQDDIDYVSRGPKTASKEEERRKLERELLNLMHERVPEVERKIKARDERKEREKRQWARDRDRANERFGRYDDKDRDRDYATRRGDDRDRPYSRNYDRDERGYDRDEREGRESRNRDREGRESRNRDRDYDPREREWDRRDTYDRPRSAAPRSPPPASPSTTLSANPTGAFPPPKPAPSPAPLKNMTPEERLAYARAQAQQRIEARKVALGVISPSSGPSSAVAIDTAVEDRLQQDKKEAEVKAKQAEKEREERERVRRERVESERAAREPVVPKPTPTPTVTAPPPVPTARTAPSAPKLRAPAPPPPRKAAPRQVPVAPKVAPVVPKVDEGRRRAEEERIRAEEERIRAEEERIRAEEERTRVEQERIRAEEESVRAEEEKFRAREEALRKQREVRAARMRQLEKEEAEQERLEEERYRARVEALKARSATPKVVEPPVKVAQEPVKIAEPVKATLQAVIPSVPQASANPVTPIEKSTNPFSRLMNQGASAPTTPAVTTPAAATNGSTNPWARPQTAPLPSKSPVSAVKTSYQTVPAANEDDWDIIKEKNESDDDSSDDELAQSRTARANIAQQLFGSMLPRPQSGGPVSSPSSPAPVSVSPPPPPPAPQAPAMFAPSPAAAAVTPAAGPGDVSALMQSIQGGMKLRPTKTVDKSAPPVSGRVIGDTAPPSHINVAPTPAQEQPNYPERVSSLPQPTSMDEPKLSNRQSVGWFTTRAADAGVSPVDQLPVTVEAEEEEDNDDIYATPPPIPAIQVDEPVSEPVSDLMADIDKSIQHRARSLYAYEGDGPEDLSFVENLVLTVHPSKSGSDWWYGTSLKDGKSGLFPKTYIDVFQTTKAKAIYEYESNNADEYSFDEGDELMIIDKSDPEWWKTERDGVVLIVPAAYLEDVEG